MSEPSGWTPDEESPEERLNSQSLAHLARALITAARAYIAAEGDRQKLRALFVLGHTKVIALCAVIALFLLFAMSIGLIVGLIWALAPPLGPWGALLAVMGGCVVMIAILGLLIWRNISRIKKGWSA